MSQPEMVIFTRTFDFLKWLLPLTDHFPLNLAPALALALALALAPPLPPFCPRFPLIPVAPANHDAPRTAPMRSAKANVPFDHEKLIAYQRSLQFLAWASPILESRTAKRAVYEQLDRASTSISLNLAEGNAKFSAPDRCRYFDTARGSALECAACLDVLVAQGQCTAQVAQAGKAILLEVVCLLIGLVRSIAPERLGEEPRAYRVGEGEQE